MLANHARLSLLAMHVKPLSSTPTRQGGLPQETVLALSGVPNILGSSSRCAPIGARIPYGERPVTRESTSELEYYFGRRLLPMCTLSRAWHTESTQVPLTPTSMHLCTGGGERNGHRAPSRLLGTIVLWPYQTHNGYHGVGSALHWHAPKPRIGGANRHLDDDMRPPHLP